MGTSQRNQTEAQKEAQRIRNREWKARNPEYAKNWYRENKEAHYTTLQRRRAEVYKYIQDCKLTRGCQKCGFNIHHAALQWHHPNNDKETAVANCRSKPSADREMAKCIVLCANCHYIHHWNTKLRDIL